MVVNSVIFNAEVEMQSNIEGVCKTISMNDNSLKQGEEKVWHKRYARKVLPVLCIAFLIHILVHA